MVKFTFNNQLELFYFNRILEDCKDQQYVQPNLNIKKLQINCSRIDTFHVALFQEWHPFLRQIENIRDNVVYHRANRTGNETCQQACGSTEPLKISTSVCVCVGNITKVDANDTKYHFHFLVIIGGVSLFTLLVNLLLLFGVCKAVEVKLPELFGLALMVFNIFMALYGVALCVYLSENNTIWEERFCQGFTSLKLFGMGASAWTFLMLTFHRSVGDGIENEREALFKGIVYILEGLMLSGVLAVMSWIKLGNWEYLCIITEPQTTVDWLLTGIELLYYFMAICLVLHYIYHQIRKKRKTEGKKLNTSTPIFLMVFICLMFWLGGYVITLRRYNFFADKMKRVIRVVSIILPLSIQPVIFALRNTFCCLCRDPPCLQNKREKGELSSDHSVLLLCECTGTEKCPACESEYDMKYGNTEFYEKEAHSGIKDDENPKKKKKKKKEKKRKNNVEEPKAIERSPVLKQKDLSLEDDEISAETPLLETQESIKSEVEKAPPKRLEITSDSTPLLDDTDGAVKQPPKAIPDSTPVKTIRKQDAQNVNSPSVPEYPSFINMDSVVDVDTLPKETPTKVSQLPITNNTSVEPDERKSRGPTFFPLTEKSSTQEEKPKKKSKKKTGEDEGEKKREGKPSKRIIKKNKKEKENGKKPVKNRESTLSLEWDHYSDSSSSISRGSESFPDDLVIPEVTVVDRKPSPVTKHNQSNGVSRSNSDKKSDTMEWDPTGEKTSINNENQQNNVKNIKAKQNTADILKNNANTNGKITPAAS